LFDWFEGVLEEAHAELLEFSSREGVVEVLSFSKSVDFDGGLVG
jgi:hypothetical protein